MNTAPMLAVAGAGAGAGAGELHFCRRPTADTGEKIISSDQKTRPVWCPWADLIFWCQVLEGGRLLRSMKRVLSRQERKGINMCPSSARLKGSVSTQSLVTLPFIKRAF
jgi:hypothetical protein